MSDKTMPGLSGFLALVYDCLNKHE